MEVIENLPRDNFDEVQVFAMVVLILLLVGYVIYEQVKRMTHDS